MLRCRMQPGTLIADRFEIRGRAAQGGMGTIFRAIDLRSSQPVAVKMLQGGGSSERERFRRECELLREVSHPGIVRYVDHGELPGAVRYLVMEWVEGETL